MGTLNVDNETYSGVFPHRWHLLPDRAKGSHIPPGSGDGGGCSHTVGNLPDRAKGSNIPLASGDGGAYNVWNTMGRLPATGRILCPSGQGTARPGPEFARGTGLARGSYGLHGASVWEAVRPSQNKYRGTGC